MGLAKHYLRELAVQKERVAITNPRTLSPETLLFLLPLSPCAFPGSRCTEVKSLFGAELRQKA